MKLLQTIYVPLVLALFLSFAVQAGEELPVPGGMVGKPWAVHLEGAIPEIGDYTIVSGPAWATMSLDGVISGTPPQSGENRWEVRVDSGAFSADYTVIAEFWAR